MVRHRSKYPRHKGRHRNRNWRRNRLVALTATLAAVGLVFVLCARREPAAMLAPDSRPYTQAQAMAVVDSIAGTDTYHDTGALDTMPDQGCVRMRPSRQLGGPLARVFNDSNYVHYTAAEHLGIRPFDSDSDGIDALTRPMVQIASNDDYVVAPLKHSYPFLVPEAADLLADVARAFNDSLLARGGGDYRLKVTSLLRTDATVHRLRRVNRCATDSSAHRFGTTFDISYTRFMLARTGGVYRTQEDLKNLLAEVVDDMRRQGRCYIKYERNSGCFHITVRAEGREPRVKS